MALRLFLLFLLFISESFVKNPMQKKAIILFSGGLDSTTCLALAKSQGFACYALSFAYGQKHDVELAAAKRVLAAIPVKAHKIISLPLDMLTGSALINKDVPILDYEENAAIPTTYVPARNTIFLSIALGWAEALGAQDIFMGANDIDYSGYPDCRPEYLQAFEKVANLATKAGVEGCRYTIHAPLLRMSKKEIIQQGLSLGVDYSLTLSCYRANATGHACGTCDSCAYRKKGFSEANMLDPTLYSIV